MRKGQLIFFLFLTTISICGCRKPHPNFISISAFKKEISSALQLKLLYHDSDYRTPYLKVFKDTLVGIVDTYNAEASYFFVQNLNNGKNQVFKLCKDQSKIYGWRFMQIEQFKDGCLFIPRFGRGTMLKIGPNCIFKEFFRSYDHIIDYANRILLYKNLAIISGFHGIYIFDIATERLLWSYPFPPPNLNDGLINTFDHYLAFSYSLSLSNGDMNTYISCVDLNNFQTVWKKTFTKDPVHLPTYSLASFSIVNDSSENFAIATKRHFQLVNFRTGAVTFDIDDSRTDTSFNPPSFILNSEKLYLSVGKTTKYIDIKSNKQIWSIYDFKILGDHDNFLVGLSADKKQYLIVNKSDGVITKRVLNPDLRHENMRFVGKYIVLNNDDIYK
jgi:hypothetical protein